MHRYLWETFHSFSVLFKRPNQIPVFTNKKNTKLMKLWGLTKISSRQRPFSICLLWRTMHADVHTTIPTHSHRNTHITPAWTCLRGPCFHISSDMANQLANDFIIVHVCTIQLKVVTLLRLNTDVNEPKGPYAELWSCLNLNSAQGSISPQI